MASSGNCSFEVSYHGKAEYPANWTISDIDLKFQGVDKEIACRINKEIPSSTEQLLRFTVRDQLNNWTGYRISLAPELAKTIKLSAKIFQYYESSRHMTRGSNGIFRPERRARRDNLPISVSRLPEFEEGKCYRIRVENDGKGLNATFVEIDETISSTQRKEQADQARAKAQHELGMKLIEQRMNHLGIFQGTPGMDQLFLGLQEMINAQQAQQSPQLVEPPSPKGEGFLIPRSQQPGQLHRL
ncbi:MAG: hypothetical protein WAM28_06035 [Chlamydiales bacterium]